MLLSGLMVTRRDVNAVERGAKSGREPAVVFGAGDTREVTPTRILALMLILSAAGCPTSQRRAGLMPRMQPIVRSAEPMERTAEAYVGSPTLVDPGDPEEVSGTNAGVVVPRWNLDGGLRFSPRYGFDIGAKFDVGLDAGSRAVRDDQPDPDRDVYGAGVTTFFSANLGPSWRLGIAGEFLLYRIPYVEYLTDPGGSFSIVEREAETIPVISLGLIPGFRVSDAISIFLGINARNHPTITRSEIGVDIFDDDEVEFGPLNIVAMAGVEVKLGSGIRALAHVFQPVLMDPVLYKPAAGLSISIPLTGSRPYDPARRAVAAPPPGPGPGYGAPPPPSGPVPAPPPGPAPGPAPPPPPGPY